MIFYIFIKIHFLRSKRLILNNTCLRSKKNFSKNSNTFSGQNERGSISSYVENIFTETPNQKFDVSVNIFSTYEEIKVFGQTPKIVLEFLEKFFFIAKREKFSIFRCQRCVFINISSRRIFFFCQIYFFIS